MLRAHTEPARLLQLFAGFASCCQLPQSVHGRGVGLHGRGKIKRKSREAHEVLSAQTRAGSHGHILNPSTASPPGRASLPSRILESFSQHRPAHGRVCATPHPASLFQTLQGSVGPDLGCLGIPHVLTPQSSAITSKTSDFLQMPHRAGQTKEGLLHPLCPIRPPLHPFLLPSPFTLLPLSPISGASLQAGCWRTLNSSHADSRRPQAQETGALRATANPGAPRGLEILAEDELPLPCRASRERKLRDPEAPSRFWRQLMSPNSAFEPRPRRCQRRQRKSAQAPAVPWEPRGPHQIQPLKNANPQGEQTGEPHRGSRGLDSADPIGKSCQHREAPPAHPAAAGAGQGGMD